MVVGFEIDFENHGSLVLQSRKGIVEVGLREECVVCFYLGQVFCRRKIVLRRGNLFKVDKLAEVHFFRTVLRLRGCLGARLGSFDNF